jgi:hypothetical protein
MRLLMCSQALPPSFERLGAAPPALAYLVVRNVQHVGVPIGQVEVVARHPGHRLRRYAFEPAYAVVLVNHVVALAKVAETG